MLVKEISVREFVESNGWQCRPPLLFCRCGTSLSWAIDEVLGDITCRECDRRYVCEDVHLSLFQQPMVHVGLDLRLVDTWWDERLPGS